MLKKEWTLALMTISGRKFFVMENIKKLFCTYLDYQAFFDKKE